MSLANQLASLTPAQVAIWASLAQAAAPRGQVNQRLERLAIADANWFAVQLIDRSGAGCSWGEVDRVFPLMSVVKPFLLLYLLEQHGQAQVLQWVDTAPSLLPFNSLEQLVADGGRPRNPMLNSGALVLCDRLAGDCDRFCTWLNHQAASRLALDRDLLMSVQQAGREPNLALLAQLQQSGQLKQPEQALETYERLCCLSGSVLDLARLGHLLAFEQTTLSAENRGLVNQVLLDCGLYEASKTYRQRFGWPLKSGISGALLAVIPEAGAIALYSPALDASSSSVAGLVFLEQLTEVLAP